VNTSRKRRRRDADIRSAAAAAARRSVTIGGGGVSKMSAAAVRRRRRTALDSKLYSLSAYHSSRQRNLHDVHRKRRRKEGKLSPKTYLHCYNFWTVPHINTKFYAPDVWINFLNVCITVKSLSRDLRVIYDVIRKAKILASININHTLLRFSHVNALYSTSNVFTVDC